MHLKALASSISFMRWVVSFATGTMSIAREGGAGGAAEGGPGLASWAAMAEPDQPVSQCHPFPGHAKCPGYLKIRKNFKGCHPYLTASLPMRTNGRRPARKRRRRRRRRKKRSRIDSADGLGPEELGK